MTLQVQTTPDARRFTRAFQSVFVSFFLAFLLPGCASATKPTQPLPPEISNELLLKLSQETGMATQTVAEMLSQFERMKKTDWGQVSSYPVDNVKSEALSGMFSAPSLAKTSQMTRLNGLIFAGQFHDGLLDFNTPSDIFRKAREWFPDVANDRRESVPNLMGPFSNWTAEASAFTMLWNCAPADMWHMQEVNPFASRKIASIDFQSCMRRKGDHFPYSQFHQNMGLGKVLPEAEAFLIRRLSQTLAQYRCTRQGADDCVLILHWWASLAPDDPELAHWLQDLPSDVGLNAPLPPLLPNESAYSSATDAPHFIEVWRRLAFINSRLISQLHAPTQWPTEAMSQELAWMMSLYPAIEQSRYRYVPGVFDPMLTLRLEPRPSPMPKKQQSTNSEGSQALSIGERSSTRVHQINEAVLKLLGQQGLQGDCEDVTRWLTYEMSVDWLERSLSQSVETLPTCLRAAMGWNRSGDTTWLLSGQDEYAKRARSVIAKHIPTMRPSLRDEILTALAPSSHACSEGGGWLLDLCATWIRGGNEEVKVSYREPLFEDFFMQAVSFHDEETDAERRKKIESLAQGLPSSTKQSLTKVLDGLAHPLSDYQSAHIWRHDRHSRAWLVLQFFNEGNSLAHHFVLGPNGAAPIRHTGRFGDDWYGYRDYIVRVTDQDNDGNLEIWKSSERWDPRSLKKCEDDEADLARDVFCKGGSLETFADVFEVDGDTLTYPRMDGPVGPPPRNEHWSFQKRISTTPAKWAQESESREQPCNAVLIGSILGPQLDIVDWTRMGEDPRLPFSVTCKAHPVNPDQVLVALFHHIPEDQWKDGLATYGFVYAVIDMQERKVLRIHTSEIEEDGATRIWGHNALNIDTARYKLKDSVRAVGIRMDIGWSPSAADGGVGNYLTLFVEDGAKLRPVMGPIPTYQWNLVDTANCVHPVWANEDRGDVPCDTEDWQTTISVSNDEHEGWRDLIVSKSNGSKSVHARWIYRDGAYQ